MTDREPLTIEVSADKETRTVHLLIREDGKRVQVLLPAIQALRFGEQLRKAVHRMGKEKAAK